MKFISKYFAHDEKSGKSATIKTKGQLQFINKVRIKVAYVLIEFVQCKLNPTRVIIIKINEIEHSSLFRSESKVTSTLSTELLICRVTIFITTQSLV